MEILISHHYGKLLPPADVAKKPRSDYEQLQVELGKWDAKRSDIVAEVKRQALEIDQYKAFNKRSQQKIWRPPASRAMVWTTIKNGARSWPTGLTTSIFASATPTVSRTNAMTRRRGGRASIRIDNLARFHLSPGDGATPRQVQSQTASIEI